MNDGLEESYKHNLSTCSGWLLEECLAEVFCSIKRLFQESSPKRTRNITIIHLDPRGCNWKQVSGCTS